MSEQKIKKEDESDHFLPQKGDLPTNESKQELQEHAP